MTFINDTWTHIRRSPYQSFAATVTMFLTMFLVGLFFLITAGSTMILRYFESKPQITVFFTDKATAADANTLKTTLQATGKVASMKYVSKDQALAIYRDQNKNDPLLLQMVTADILPASLEVSAVDPNYLKDLAPVIQKAQGVEEVVFQKDVVDALLRWTNAIRWVGGILVVIFSVNAILIVMTVIGMKIALKKEEIEILQLVGASPWYIRFPFILEGGLYGFVGSFFSWIILVGLLIWQQPAVAGFLGMIPFIHAVFVTISSWTFVGAMAAFLGLLAFVGFLLGAVGSLVALGRYLRF